MSKNLLDSDWNKFEKTGNVVDYLKYKAREKMVKQNINSNDMEIGTIKGAKEFEDI